MWMFVIFAVFYQKNKESQQRQTGAKKKVCRFCARFHRNYHELWNVSCDHMHAIIFRKWWEWMRKFNTISYILSAVLGFGFFLPVIFLWLTLRPTRRWRRQRQCTSYFILNRFVKTIIFFCSCTKLTQLKLWFGFACLCPSHESSVLFLFINAVSNRDRDRFYRILAIYLHNTETHIYITRWRTKERLNYNSH